MSEGRSGDTAVLRIVFDHLKKYKIETRICRLLLHVLHVSMAAGWFYVSQFYV